MFRVGFGGKKELGHPLHVKRLQKQKGMKGKGQKRASESSSKAHHDLRTFVHH